MAHRSSWRRIGFHLLCWAPLLYLLWGIWQTRLGPDPVGEAMRRSGRYALVLLLLALLPTVLSRTIGLAGAIRYRRSLGLYGFMYAGIHLMIYVGLDYALDLGLLLQGLGQSPFVLAGLAAWGLLVPLAATSTRGAMQRLGRNWRRLHRLAYLASALAVLHYAWRAKEIRVMPLVAGLVLALLMILRLPPVVRWLSGRRGGADGAQAP